MNGCREDDNNGCCYFHPKEVIIGVCALCLNEKLIELASKQGHGRSSGSSNGVTTIRHRKSPINLPKIFDFSSILHRRSDSCSSSDHDDASSSQEDSFISIKFEENGAASWEKNAKVMTKVSLESYTKSWKKLDNSKQSNNKKDTKSETNMSVIEHQTKSHGSLRWRKRIGHLFHLVQWKKRSNKGSVCHVKSTKVEGVKVRKKGNWIGALKKKRTYKG